MKAQWHESGINNVTVILEYDKVFVKIIDAVEANEVNAILLVRNFNATLKLLKKAPCSVITTKSRSLLDFWFEIKLADLKKHHEEGTTTLEKNDPEKALNNLILAHEADIFHVPTLVKLHETYQEMGNASKVKQFKN